MCKHTFIYIYIYIYNIVYDIVYDVVYDVVYDIVYNIGYDIGYDIVHDHIWSEMPLLITSIALARPVLPVRQQPSACAEALQLPFIWNPDTMDKNDHIRIY